MSKTTNPSLKSIRTLVLLLLLFSFFSYEISYSNPQMPHDALVLANRSDTVYAELMMKPFADMTEYAGVNWAHYRRKQNHTTGQAWGDYNGDGWLDLYITSQEVNTNMFYVNNKDGTFSESPMADTVILSSTAESAGVNFADYDNDGDKDLYVVNTGANVLFRNDGDSFVDVTNLAGVGDIGQGTTASWGDYDNDGLLDLYVANWWDNDCQDRAELDCSANSDRLFRNEGNGIFRDVTHSLGDEELTGFGFVATFFDYDNDGDLDIYLVNDQFTPSYGNLNGNHLWRNDGAGCDEWCWTDVSAETGTNYLLCGMGLAVGDYDKDGDLDIYFSNGPQCGEGGIHHLLQNQTAQGKPIFKEVTLAANLEFSGIGWGTAFFDYDNDGWLDLYLASGSHPNPLYRNNQDGTFTEVNHSGADDFSRTHGVAYGDYNRDGWIDLYISNFERVDDGRHLYKNQAALLYPDHHWLSVELVGDGSNVNRDGVGARVYLNLEDELIHFQEVKNGSSLGAGNQLALHFGLGDFAQDTIPEVIIVWPDGRQQVLRDVAYDQFLVVEYQEPSLFLPMVMQD